MNTKVIEAQIHAQALAESYRQAVVNFNQHKTIAEQSRATVEAARSRMDELRREVQEAHAQLDKLAEQHEARRRLAGVQ